MKKLGVVVMIMFLVVLLLAGPADAYWRHGGWRGGHGHFGAGFVVGLGFGALLTAPFWYPPAYAYPVYTPAYTYPAYTYPAYPYPAYSYPAYTGTYVTVPAYTPPSTLTPTPEPVTAPPPVPQSGVTSPPPGAPASPGTPSASTPTCQTVWVEGHYETRVLQSGQRYTVWIPGQSQQICQ